MEAHQLMQLGDGLTLGLLQNISPIEYAVCIQFPMAIIALIQILKRQAPTDQKILWSALAWFIPVVGPILWWSIGSKQVGTPPRPPEFPHERRD